MIHFVIHCALLLKLSWDFQLHKRYEAQVDSAQQKKLYQAQAQAEEV